MTLRQISEVGKLAVVDLDTGDVLGEVTDWIVAPTEQKVVAYVLKKEGWLGRPKIIMPADIVEYGPRMLIINHPDSIISPKEVVGLNEKVEARSNLIGCLAEDESGESLGKVSDFFFDITDNSIQRYYIKPAALGGLLHNDLVLVRRQVVKAEPGRIVFRTDPKELGRIRVEAEARSV